MLNSVNFEGHVADTPTYVVTANRRVIVTARLIQSTGYYNSQNVWVEGEAVGRTIKAFGGLTQDNIITGAAGKLIGAAKGDRMVITNAQMRTNTVDSKKNPGTRISFDTLEVASASQVDVVMTTKIRDLIKTHGENAMSFNRTPRMQIAQPAPVAEVPSQGNQAFANQTAVHGDPQASEAPLDDKQLELPLGDEPAQEQDQTQDKEQTETAAAPIKSFGDIGAALQKTLAASKAMQDSQA